MYIRTELLSLIMLLMIFSGCAKKTGPAGPAGVPGADATEPTPIQVCPGTTHYPDTYCEVVFCYNGNLYGTYSSLGAFSTEIPPGQYGSSGVNCSCTVAIGPNCDVSN